MKCFKTKLLTITIIFALSLNSYAQNATIKGKETSNNIAVQFVDLFLKGTSYGVSTDDTGSYQIKNIPAGTYTIIASSLGFSKQEKRITLIPNQQLTINFNLVEDSASLDEVVISGTMKEVSKLESPVPVEVYSATFFKSNPTPSRSMDDEGRVNFDDGDLNENSTGYGGYKGSHSAMP